MNNSINSSCDLLNQIKKSDIITITESQHEAYNLMQFMQYMNQQSNFVILKNIYTYDKFKIEMQKLRINLSSNFIFAEEPNKIELILAREYEDYAFRASFLGNNQDAFHVYELAAKAYSKNNDRKKEAYCYYQMAINCCIKLGRNDLHLIYLQKSLDICEQHQLSKLANDNLVFLSLHAKYNKREEDLTNYVKRSKTHMMEYQLYRLEKNITLKHKFALYLFELKQYDSVSDQYEDIIQTISYKRTNQETDQFYFDRLYCKKDTIIKLFICNVAKMINVIMTHDQILLIQRKLVEYSIEINIGEEILSHVSEFSIYAQSRTNINEMKEKYNNFVNKYLIDDDSKKIFLLDE